MNRVKYLFGKVFEKLNDIKIEYIETDENEPILEKEEISKLLQLQNNPYGKWDEYITNSYLTKYTFFGEK